MFANSLKLNHAFCQFLLFQVAVAKLFKVLGKTSIDKALFCKVVGLLKLVIWNWSTTAEDFLKFCKSFTPAFSECQTTGENCGLPQISQNF